MKLLRIYSTSIAEFRVRKQVIRVCIDVRTCKQIGKRKCLDICIYIYTYIILLYVYIITYENIRQIAQARILGFLEHLCLLF